MDEILSVNGAAWTATAFFGLALVRMWSGLPQVLDKWLAYRTARAAEKAADWTRLRDELNRLHDWCQELQKEVDECRIEKSEWMHRAIAAEAQQVGLGAARQELTVLETRERVVRDKGKEK